MDSNFFALISRMRYIARWGLMRNALPENIQEHSHMVAVLAHALGVIRRDIFHEPCDVNALATAALYHDASEILTGDLPTPIKYHNAEIMSAYHAVEDLAVQKLLGMLPPELRPLVFCFVVLLRREALPEVPSFFLPAVFWPDFAVRGAFSSGAADAMGFLAPQRLR